MVLFESFISCRISLILFPFALLILLHVDGGEITPWLILSNQPLSLVIFGLVPYFFWSIPSFSQDLLLFFTYPLLHRGYLLLWLYQMWKILLHLPTICVSLQHDYVSSFSIIPIGCSNRLCSLQKTTSLFHNTNFFCNMEDDN